MAALKIPEGRHKLKLGRSFDKKSKEIYQTVRYDFKPASVEECKESYAEFGSTSEVVVSVPKLDTNGEVKDVTLFKGSRKPCQKECLLIYDHDTGEFTLEEVMSNVHLKQVRSGEEEKEKNLQYVREIRKKFVKSDNCLPSNVSSVSVPLQQQQPQPNNDVLMSDHSDDSSEDDASDNDEEQSNSEETGSEDDKDKDIANALEAELGVPAESNLKDDLHLSDDTSDESDEE